MKDTILLFTKVTPFFRFLAFCYYLVLPIPLEVSNHYCYTVNPTKINRFVLHVFLKLKDIQIFYRYKCCMD